MSGTRRSYATPIVIVGSGVSIALDHLFGFGGLGTALIVLVFGTASAVSWVEGFQRASIGYLLFVGALGVLALFGIQGNTVGIIVFFGCLLVGAGLVIYEAIVRVEKRNGARNGSAG